MSIFLPDDHLRYPYREEVTYLDWYRGKFEAVFVALHPFFKIEGISPEDVAWGTHIIDNRGPQPEIPRGADFMSEAERLRALSHHGKIAAEEIEALIPRRANPVPWTEICAMADLDTVGEVNRALLAHIKGLNRKFVDEDGQARLEQSCQSAGIFLPTEGEFQVLHRSLIRRVFSAVGAKTVFGENDIDQQKSYDRLFGSDWDPSHRRLWSADETVLMTVHWDSFFTLICLDETRLRTVDLSGFEGFWAEANVGHDWWMSEATRRLL